MSPYTKQQHVISGSEELHIYVGSPNCSTFYRWVLDSLLEFMHPEFGPPVPPLKKITKGQMGNLGESITFLVGRADRFDDVAYTQILRSALTPFNPSALTGVDIFTVYLDPNGIEANDRLFIQEIKTTGAPSLAYSRALVEDYDKLFNTTNPPLSLFSRISAVKGELKFVHRFPPDKLQRVENLVQITAAQCTQVRLLPTLVHDLGSCPKSSLGEVVDKIKKQGWPAGTIEAWSISMTQLRSKLIDLANRS